VNFVVAVIADRDWRTAAADNKRGKFLVMGELLTEMNEIQEYLLKLTLEIDEICTEHDIDYVLCGGSSLGIERNGGFLPWDDDLDIIMTEKNYHKFVKVMQENPREGRVLESPETNPEFPLHFGKYMSTEASGLVRALGYGNCHGGIWIDIFYLCPLSRDPEEAKSMIEWFQVYCEFQNRRFPEIPHHVEGLAEKYREALRKSKRLGYEKTLKWIEQKFNFVEEEDCDRYFIHHALTATIKTYSKKHLEHIVRRPFEGHMLPFSATNREFCREAYGDTWMMVPDIVEQDTHDAIYDTKVPYTVYLNDYMQMLDKETVDKDLLEYKKKELFYVHEFYEKNQVPVKLQAMVDQADQNKILDRSDYRKMAEDHRWDLLSELFTEYSELLRKRVYSLYDYYPELDRDKTEVYLETLIRYEGTWSYAERMMKIFHLPESAEKRLQNLIDHCRAVSIARYDLRDNEMVERAVAAFRAEDADHCHEVDMGELDLACKKRDYEGMQRLLSKYRSFYPEETEEMLLAKAILQKHNGEAAAAETIDVLLETGRDGVLLMDLWKGVYELQV